MHKRELGNDARTGDVWTVYHTPLTKDKRGAKKMTVAEAIKPSLRLMAAFKIRYVDIPECPEVAYYIRPHKRTVYINRAAHAGAKVVRLVF